MDSNIQKFVAKTTDFLNPTKIYLFGSRAEGTSCSTSDYDILVVYDGPLSKRDVKVGIRERLPHKGFALDLFVLTSDELERYRHVVNTLANEVERSGVLVYG